ncbi:conserved hypothetical protein [Aspergillus udagawae]|uniref:Uncharacterized protein n=1 Tax=Aspergillus udagawae TaxID=91492 RepID=A0A8H3SE58_9EURO|nr:conserved hypothetical protein [Aspergillus udagawae]
MHNSRFFDLDQLVLVLCRRSDAPSTFGLVFLWTRPLPVRFNNDLFHIRRCGIEYIINISSYWWPWNKPDTTMWALVPVTARTTMHQSTGYACRRQCDKGPRFAAWKEDTSRT